MRLGVGCPCPPVRNDIVTPCHLFQNRHPYFCNFGLRVNLFIAVMPASKLSSPLISRDILGIERKLFPGGHSGFVLVLRANRLRFDHFISKSESIIESRGVVFRRSRRREAAEYVTMRHYANRRKPTIRGYSELLISIFTFFWRLGALF